MDRGVNRVLRLRNERGEGSPHSFGGSPEQVQAFPYSRGASPHDSESVHR